MVNCPDCATKMRLNPPYYVCPACGLTVKKLEMERAFSRTRNELKTARGQSDDEMREEKRRKRRDYLDWLMKK